MPSELINMKEVTDILNISYIKFYSMRETGELPNGVSRWKGSRKYWDKAVIIKFRDERDATNPPKALTNYEKVMLTLNKSSRGKNDEDERVSVDI